MVFLGGAPTVWDVFDPIARRITSDFEAIQVALPGYGPSPAPEGPYDLDAAHAAVERTLVDAGISSCALVGFSGGAYRALAIAARGRVRATHVYALAGFSRYPPEAAGALVATAARIREGLDLAALAPELFLSPRFASLQDKVDAVREWATAAPPALLAAELEAFAAAPDLGEALREAAFPVVARVGSADRSAPPALSESIVRACARASLEIVEDAGHALPIEDPEGTAASIRRMLAA
ncbi:MAG TPA: alpha/beta hydrolase [Vulgatibacter sp.]